MRGLRLGAALAAAFLATAIACDDDDLTLPQGVEVFRADLNGANERPDPVTTTATGTAVLTVMENQVSWRIDVQNIDNANAAHIHGGTADEFGGVMVGLDPDVPTDPATGFSGVLALGSVEVVDSVLTRMRNGSAYVNVHTTANGAGEIRGQIRRVQ